MGLRDKPHRNSTIQGVNCVITEVPTTTANIKFKALLTGTSNLLRLDYDVEGPAAVRSQRIDELTTVAVPCSKSLDLLLTFV